MRLMVPRAAAESWTRRVLIVEALHEHSTAALTRNLRRRIPRDLVLGEQKQQKYHEVVLELLAD